MSNINTGTTNIPIPDSAYARRRKSTELCYYTAWQQTQPEAYSNPVSVDEERETPLASVEKFGNIYGLMAHNLFFDDYDSFQAANTSMFGKEDWKQRLEDFFKIEL